MGWISFYYYNIIPQIESNFVNVPKSNEYIEYHKVEGEDYYSVELAEELKEKYKKFILGAEVPEALKKVMNELISSKWYCKIDKKGFVKLWGVFDSESLIIEYEHLIQWRFETIYHNLKNQLHEHLFLNLKKGLPIFSKKELAQEEVYKRIYYNYIKKREDIITKYISYILKLKNKISKLLNNIFPWLWPWLWLPYVAHIHSKLSGYTHLPKNIIWMQEYLEIQFQNALNIEIKEDRRNSLLKLWISKLSDIQNSIRFGLQMLALIFAILFELINPSIFDNFLLFVYLIVISSLIPTYVFEWTSKKEIKSSLEVINIY